MPASKTTKEQPKAEDDQPREMARGDFARRLQRILLDKKPAPWSQSDLARASGLGRDAISTYIRGRSTPTPHSLKKIADALGVAPEDLMPLQMIAAPDNEPPALEIRQMAGSVDRVWLRVNQAVTLEQAASIMAVLRRKDAE